MRNVNKELSGSLVELDQAATPEVTAETPAE